jgi:hypothetical protein
MFIRWTLPNGTFMWHRADMIRSIEKNAENPLQTVVWIDRTNPDPRKGYIVYAALESQQEICDAAYNAMKTGMPTIVQDSALGASIPPKSLISN